MAGVMSSGAAMVSTSPSAELTSAPAEPAMVADDSGSIWVSGKNVVIRIDAGTRQISDVIEVGSGGQLLAADGVIWVAGQDGTISRIDNN